MSLALLVGAAFGQDDPSTLLHDAMLREALDGDLERAVATYRELANVSVDHPAHGLALYRLGVSLADLGRLDEARQALQEGIRTGACARCRGALEELEIERQAVTALPTLWTFDDAGHGVFHPIDAQALGAIRLEVAPGGRTALRWRIDARPGEDHLVFALASGARTLRLVVLSADDEGLLGVRVEDELSRRYSTEEPIRFPAGAWTEAVVELAALAPEEPGDPPLEPARVARIELVDPTGLRRSGPVTWWVDELELR